MRCQCCRLSINQPFSTLPSASALDLSHICHTFFQPQDIPMSVQCLDCHTVQVSHFWYAPTRLHYYCCNTAAHMWPRVSRFRLLHQNGGTVTAQRFAPFRQKTAMSGYSYSLTVWQCAAVFVSLTAHKIAAKDELATTCCNLPCHMRMLLPAKYCLNKHCWASVLLMRTGLSVLCMHDCIQSCLHCGH